MKLFVFIFGFLVAANIAVANPICATQTKYKQRVDLENGKTLFIEPGLYTSGKSYRLLCADPGANFGYRCAPEVHEACKYLGMKKASTWSFQYDIGEANFMYFYADGKMSFMTDHRRAFVSELVCE